ncbi:hypothetical protein UFOVP783_114 [uncultured Caudovirales phage]|uniref:Uncharacterized protein n=1 Tax=uncultured Caudovirales phage TaxID=2100421 RepID=A0A6J5P5G0_9CAUD|nr:hypothetical protein UFOVP783_114 [uncultured Caudovirales phage]
MNQPNTNAPRLPLDLWTITAAEFFHLIESFKEVAASLDLSLTFVGQLCTVEGHVFQLVVGDAKPAYPIRAHGTPPRSLAYANAGMLMADAAKKLRGVSASRILKQTDGTSRWRLILPNGVEVAAWVKPQTENEPEKPAEPAQEGGEGTDSAPTPQTPPCGQPGEESAPLGIEAAAGKTPAPFPAFLMDSPNDSNVIRTVEQWRYVLRENRNPEETLAETEEWMLTALKSPNLATVFIEGGSMETELVPEFGFTDKHSDSYTLRDYFTEHGIPLVPQPDEPKPAENVAAGESIPPPPSTPPSGEKFAVGEQVELKESIHRAAYNPPVILSMSTGKIVARDKACPDTYHVKFYMTGDEEPIRVHASTLGKVKGGLLDQLAEGVRQELAKPTPSDEKFAAGKNTPDIFTQATATLLNKLVEEITAEQRDALHTLIRAIPSLPYSPHEPTPSPHTPDANQTSGDSEIQKMPVWQRMKEGSPKQDKEIANPNQPSKKMQGVQTAEEEPFDALHAALDAASGINFHKGSRATVSGCTVLEGIDASAGTDTGDKPSQTLYGVLRERDKAQVLAAAKLGPAARAVVTPDVGILTAADIERHALARTLEMQPSGAFRAAFTPKTRDPYQRDTPTAKPNHPAHNPLSEPALLASSIIEDAFRQGPEAVAALKYVLKEWQANFARMKGQADANARETQDKRDAMDAVIAASGALTPEEIEQTAAEAFAELQPIVPGDRVALTKQIDNVYGALPVGAEGTATQKVGGSLILVDFDGAPFQQSVSIDRLRRLPPLSPPAPAQKFAEGDRVALTDTIGQIADALVAGREGIVRTTWDDSNRSVLVEFDHKPGYRFCVHSTRLQKVAEPAPTSSPPAPSMNPDWSEAEREAIARLAKEKDMSPQGVLRQSLRTYQMFHHARRDPNGPDGQAWRELAQLPPPPSPKPDAMIEPVSAALYRGMPVRVLGYEIAYTHEERNPEPKYRIEDHEGTRVWVLARYISPVTANA